jgi:hypothetical protein
LISFVFLGLLGACASDGASERPENVMGPLDVAAPPGSQSSAGSGPATMVSDTSSGSQPPAGGTAGGTAGTTGSTEPAGTAGAPALPMGGGDFAPLPPLEDRIFDAGTDPARNQVQAGQVCTRLAQIQCAGEAFCCENPGRDRATCEVVMRDGCINQLYLDAMTENPDTGFDPAAAATTMTQIETMASTCDVGIAEFGASPDGLMGMFRGTVEAGESCSPGLTTNEAAAAGALASCADVNTTACLPRSALSWRCDPRGQVGDDCFSDLNCVDGLYCPNPDLDLGGAQCAQRLPDGSPCSLPNECASLFCKAGQCAPVTVQNAYCLQ